MSLNLFLGLHNRVIQVLKDYLPAALDAIDTEQATGDVTPDVQSEDYRVARRYMVRLETDEFSDEEWVSKLAAAGGMTPQEMRRHFARLR